MFKTHFNHPYPELMTPLILLGQSDVIFIDERRHCVISEVIIIVIQHTTSASPPPHTPSDHFFHVQSLPHPLLTVPSPPYLRHFHQAQFTTNILLSTWRETTWSYCYVYFILYYYYYYYYYYYSTALCEAVRTYMDLRHTNTILMDWLIETAWYKWTWTQTLTVTNKDKSACRWRNAGHFKIKESC